MSALRHQSKPCKYGAMLDKMIWDRMVCGINNEVIQYRLLAEEDTLTLEKTFDIAVTMETAASDAWDITKATGKTAEPEAVVNAMKHNFKRGRPCCRSKRARHDPADCPFKEAECYKCGKMGHTAPACHSDKKKTANSNTFSQSKSTAKGKHSKYSAAAHQVEAKEEKEPQPDKYSLLSCTALKVGHAPAYKT